jgi:hypothetical protein
MDFVAHLWIPIVASASAVWIASALAWMALPHHKNDFKQLPDENAFAAAIRGLGIAPGSYGFPRCDHKKMKDPEFQKKWNEGPVGTLSVWGKMSMGKNMLATFLVYLIVSIFIAYLGWAVFPHGGAELTRSRVFQVLGTAGVLAYSFSFIPGGIWFGQSGRSLAMGVIDGIVYGLVTGGVFALLWPGAA